MIHIRLSTLVEMPIKCELVGTPTHTNTHVWYKQCIWMSNETSNNINHSSSLITKLWMHLTVTFSYQKQKIYQSEQFDGSIWWKAY